MQVSGPQYVPWHLKDFISVPQFPSPSSCWQKATLRIPWIVGPFPLPDTKPCRATPVQDGDTVFLSLPYSVLLASLSKITGIGDSFSCHFVITATTIMFTSTANKLEKSVISHSPELTSAATKGVTSIL